MRTPCVTCRVHADCGVDGFCDSAMGYVCSKRCRTNNDCANNELWDGNYCRGDGRCSPKVFETVWELTSADPTVVLPFDVDYPGAKCDFQILWGDEPVGTDITKRTHVTDCTILANRTHAYARAGRYNVKIIGTYDGWGAFNKINIASNGYSLTSGAPKLRSVLSFGPVGLSSRAFSVATELRLMPEKDVPDASKLKSLASTFSKASLFNAPIGHWDTSSVTDMSAMFFSAQAFNQPIDTWDTSKVTDMSRMFSYPQTFNQPIGAWDTSSVTNMSRMFSYPQTFNQPIGAWDTSSVTNMSEMFQNAYAFNRKIGAWNTSNVTEMCSMFQSAAMFNREIGAWDTSQVKLMHRMFSYASAFNQALNEWDTSEVIDMSEMFYQARDFNQPIGAWDTSEVTYMSGMFYYAERFNQPLADWDVSQVTRMERMFGEARAFDQDLSAWNLNTNVYFYSMFSGSAMSESNQCALYDAGGEWLEQWWELGLYAHCEGD